MVKTNAEKCKAYRMRYREILLNQEAGQKRRYGVKIKENQQKHETILKQKKIGKMPLTIVTAVINLTNLRRC